MQARASGRSVRPDAEAGIRVSIDAQPLWQFDFAEVTAHNLEARGRKEVNRLLAAGWRLLHVYTLRYEQDEVWRERPMAILGRLRNVERETCKSPVQEGPMLLPVRSSRQ